MAETKGITIDFYGNTLEFDKSIDGINKALKLTKNELSTLNKELKLDPSNVDKLTERFNKLKQQQSLLAEQVDMYKKRLAELGNYNDLTKEQQKEFEAISKALGSCEVELAKVNKQLASMPTANLQKLSKEFDEIGNKLNNIGSKVESVGKALTPLSIATTGLITAGVKYNATLEQQTALFTTLTGSAEQAEKVLSSIKGDAMKSPFDVQSLISANQYLIATGMEADKSREVIMALGDAISATGGGNSELQRMAQNLQQVQNVGKASSMDMKQFAMAGIDIWGILADSTGKTVKELQQMDISFDMIADALKGASKQGGKYYGAMEKQSQTLTGSINKLKSSFSELLGLLTETLMPVIKKVLEVLQDWINRLKNLDDNQINLITRIGLIVAAAGPLLVVLGKLIGESGIGGLALKISSFLKSETFLAWLGKVSTAGGGLTGVLKVLMSALSSLLNPITLVVGALALAYATNEDFRKTVNKLVGELLNALKPAFDTIKQTIGFVISVIQQIIGVIGNLISIIAQALAPVLSTWISLLGSVISVASSLASFLIGSLFFAIKTVIDIISEIVNSFRVMFNTLANTSFGQGFINVMNSIGNAINGVIGWVQSAISWFQSAIDFGNQLLGIQNATNSNQKRYGQVNNRAIYGETGNSSLVRSSGFGDISLTTNIHIDNNGMPIDEQEVNRWVNAMTDKLDVALGGRL